MIYHRLGVTDKVKILYKMEDTVKTTKYVYKNYD